MEGTERVKPSAEEYSSGDSYGGSRFRIDYDRYESQKATRKQSPHLSSVLAGILLFAVFLLLGVLINRYFHSGLDRNSEALENSDTPVSASFQCYFYE